MSQYLQYILYGFENSTKFPKSEKNKAHVQLGHVHYTVKLGNKERFDKEQIGIKEPFPVTNLPFTS